MNFRRYVDDFIAVFAFYLHLYDEFVILRQRKTGKEKMTRPSNPVMIAGFESSDSTNLILKGTKGQRITLAWANIDGTIANPALATADKLFLIQQRAAHRDALEDAEVNVKGTIGFEGATASLA